MQMIHALIYCDEFEDIATLKVRAFHSFDAFFTEINQTIGSQLDKLIDTDAELSEKLCQIGDSIVYKLVQWTRRLPFHSELPMDMITHLLTHKWHELLVLTTCAYQAIHGDPPAWRKSWSPEQQPSEQDFRQQVGPHFPIPPIPALTFNANPVELHIVRQLQCCSIDRLLSATRSGLPFSRKQRRNQAIRKSCCVNMQMTWTFVCISGVGQPSHAADLPGGHDGPSDV